MELLRTIACATLLGCAACNAPARVDAPPRRQATSGEGFSSSAAPSESTAPAAPSADLGQSSATAPYAPPPSEAVVPIERRKHNQIGTLDDWVKDYAGSSVPETKRPPALRLPKDLGLSSGLVAFARSTGIYTFDFANNAETHLRSGFASKPTFSPDGTRIYYVGHDGDFVLHIRSMDTKGGDDRDVTGAVRTKGRGLSFALSSNGRFLAYIDQPGDEEELRGRIHLVDLRAHQDTVVGPLDQYGQPWFSAESDRLFVVIDHYPANGSIASIDLASRALKHFPDAGEAVFNSPFSLGDRVVFAAGPTGAACCLHEWLFSVNKDGADIQKLGSFEKYGSAYPRRSPRGRKIAIEWGVREGGFGADYRNDITVVDADGLRERELTSAFPRPFYAASEPAWAPDDRHLVFTLRICPYVGCELEQDSVVAVDTNDPTSAPAFLAPGSSPSWSPSAR